MLIIQELPGLTVVKSTEIQKSSTMAKRRELTKGVMITHRCGDMREYELAKLFCCCLHLEERISRVSLLQSKIGKVKKAPQHFLFIFNLQQRQGQTPNGRASPTSSRVLLRRLLTAESCLRPFPFSLKWRPRGDLSNPRGLFCPRSIHRMYRGTRSVWGKDFLIAPHLERWKKPQPVV
jgi:hypothetical protein